MSADSFVGFGWDGSDTTIVAVGTASDPIRFTGAEETAGFWQGLWVGSGVRSDSRFEYVEIAHAGGAEGDGACLRLETAVVVSNCSFFASSGYGILREPGDGSDYQSSNAFAEMTLGAVGSN